MDETSLDPSVLSGLNSTYIADLYEKWLDDPNHVDSNWKSWFENLKSNGSSNDVPDWAKGKPFPFDIIETDKKAINKNQLSQDNDLQPHIPLTDLSLPTQVAPLPHQL